jgi:hypothetical protein
MEKYAFLFYIALVMILSTSRKRLKRDGDQY